MAEAPNFLRGLFTRRDVSGSQGTISAQMQGNQFIEGYLERDIYNQGALEKEFDRVAKEMKGMQDGFKNLQLKAHSPRDIRDYQSWQQAQKKAWDVFYYLASLDEPYQAKVASSRAGAEPLTVGEFCHYQVLHMGGELLISDLLRQQLSYAVQHGFADSFKPYADLQAHTFGVSRTNIKIGETSLANVLEADQRKDGSANQYRFLMDSIFIAYRRSHNSVFKANRQGFFKQYPNTAKYLIEALSAEVRAGIVSSPDIVDDEIRCSSGIPREAAQKGKQFVGRIGNIREGIFRNVMDPQSPEFNSLQETVTSYMRQGKFERVNALYVLGLDRFDHIHQMYRAARAFQERGVQSQSNFYKNLAEAVLEYTHSGLTDGVILNEEDAYEVLAPEQPMNQTPATVQSFGAIIGSIFSKGSQRIFDNIDPLVVDSTGFSRPQAIATVFDQNRPQRFTVHLRWENQYGESTDLNLYFDTKQAALRDAFDWNFLKLPSDPDMRAINAAAISATQAILVSINADATRAYQEKQQRRATFVTPQGSKTKQKREHTTDEAYEIRKQARQEARVNPQAARVDLSEAIEIVTVPRRILTPEPTELDGMLRNIHSDERGDVLKAIDRFNEEGAGEFTRKRSKGQGGETLYTLRVGRNRVLVYEIESSNGVRQFEIMDIDDRSRIYRKNKI